MQSLPAASNRSSSLPRFTRRARLVQLYVPAASRPPTAPPCSLLDWFLGYFLFAFLFLLSIIFVVDKVQGALLFNMKFAKALEVRERGPRWASADSRQMRGPGQRVGPLGMSTWLAGWPSQPSVSRCSCLLGGCSAPASWRPTTSPPTWTAHLSAPRSR